MQNISWTTFHPLRLTRDQVDLLVGAHDDASQSAAEWLVALLASGCEPGQLWDAVQDTFWGWDEAGQCRTKSLVPVNCVGEEDWALVNSLMTEDQAA